MGAQRLATLGIVSLLPLSWASAQSATAPTVPGATLPTVPTVPANTSPTVPPTTSPTVSAPAEVAASASTSAAVSTAAADSDAIAVNIDGHVSRPDPAPLLIGGAVFVPLRGVLENLGAKVEYFPLQKRIDITQNGKKYLLRPGIEGATVGAEILPLTAPKIIGGRAFVPLRAVAELFGYRVAWLAARRTVAIYSGNSLKPVAVDHRAELRDAGAFGVEIDFSQVSPAQIPLLLDAAKSSGAGLIKTRFDWATLQPTEGADFNWTLYDDVVREARTRGLRVVGILGDSARWASVSSSSVTDDWRNSPPKDKQLAAWTNYVSRVVGRYRVDVQAWQIWENPSAQNFRSVPRTYRKLARAAVDAARIADPKAVVHAAEPGGVELDFISDLNTNGLTPLLDGVSVFPVSQWQPGVLNPSENFVLPYATLRDKLRVADGKTRDYWLGGVSTEALEAPAGALPTDAQKGPLSTYSAATQADYLVRMFSLALASGAEKVFWSQLHDDISAQTSMTPAPTLPASTLPVATTPAQTTPAQTTPTSTTTPTVPPVLLSGAGLLRADGSPRPALNAFKLMAQTVGAKPYAGNLSFDENVVALLFDDKKSGTLVVWSPAGSGTLSLSSQSVNPQLPGAIFVATRPDSLVMDSSGAVIAPPDGSFKISQRPIFITNVALETAQATRPIESSLRLSSLGVSYAKAGEVKASFGSSGGEDGLFWRRFEDFGGMAQHVRLVDGREGLDTEAQRNIMDLKSQKPFIYLDVADDFLYFAGGVPVTITVEVHRPSPSAASIVNSASGFRLEYDSPTGYKSTPFQEVEAGDGWATYTFQVPDATFSNAEGYDLLINAGGSKRDLTFGSVSVRRAADIGAATPAVPVL